MKKLRIFLVLGLIVAGLLVAHPASAAAPDRSWNQDQIIHVVQPGENLFRISLRYGTTVDAIMAVNGLTDAHTVYAGQRLLIPQSSGSASSSQGSFVAGGTYTVQRGEVLSRIALRYGVAVEALMQANHLLSPHTIYAGQRLLIPAADGSVPALAPGVSGTYVVQPREVLSEIARRFGTSSDALARLNGIANPTAIYPGQVLRLSEDVPLVPAGGKRIVMDLSEQHLYAYAGEQLVYSFTASSGVAPTYTRAGQFRVQSKVPNAYGSTWDIWMPHWLGIYWAGSTENGIHALPILSNGQTLWAGYLGRPVSYGCIVLGSLEAELLYNWVDVGTPVTVRY